MDTRPATRRSRPAAACAALLGSLWLVTAGCDYDPSAPGRSAGGRGGGGGGVDMTGEWGYEADLFLAAEGVTCSIEQMVLRLQQSDSTFTGSYSGATLICRATGVPPDTVLRDGTGAVVNGLVRRDSVFFDIDAPDFRHAGRLSGTTVTGTAVMILDPGRVLSGSFSVAK